MLGLWHGNPRLPSLGYSLAAMSLRILAVAACLFCSWHGRNAALASEKDGGHAAPRRWTHARGPAAYNGRTLAEPVRSWGGPRWTYRAHAKVRGVPVTWDGIAFVLDGADLVALDLVDGSVLARTAVAARHPEIAVESRAVLVREQGNRLALFRLADRKFHRIWSHECQPDSSAPRILGGEVYWCAPDGLRMIRLGSRKPTWIAAGRYAGAPAVYGGHVYALREDSGKLVLAAHDRGTGKIAARVDLGAGRGGVVGVSQRLVAAKVGNGEWAFLARQSKDGKLTLKFGSRQDASGVPLVGNRVGIARTDGGWALLRSTAGKKSRVVLIKKKDRPELLAGACNAIAHPGSDIGFGTWCGDVNANTIHWHANEGRTLSGGVACAVPAGHRRLLMVAADRKQMVLLGPRIIGKRLK